MGTQVHSTICLVEKQLSIQVEEKEIIRAEKELTATTRLPADARAYETKVLAEGSRLAKLKAAEGEAQKIRLLGAADASAIEAVSICFEYKGRVASFNLYLRLVKLKPLKWN